MNALAMQSFGFGDQLVRTVERGGAAWFVGNDVCAALEIGNSRDALARLDDDERDCVGITDAIGRERETTIISESGVYSLTFTSRKEAAKRFKRWVTHEVLPTLRQTGRYIMAGNADDAAPALVTPDEFASQRMKLYMLDMARKTFGAAAARRAWRIAGLPDVSDPDAIVSSAGIGVIEAIHRSLAEWLEARTIAAPGHREETQRLYRDYVGWSRDEGYQPTDILTLPGFGKALTRCNVGAIKTNRMHRVGLRLAD